LDAWKLALPLVVVPNTQLLDDHQTEMARYLAQEGYAIMSTTRYAPPPYRLGWKGVATY
jgi:beta-1,4-N-acetylglucosaminyltransferase